MKVTWLGCLQQMHAFSYPSIHQSITMQTDTQNRIEMQWNWLSKLWRIANCLLCVFGCICNWFFKYQTYRTESMAKCFCRLKIWFLCNTIFSCWTVTKTTTKHFFFWKIKNKPKCNSSLKTLDQIYCHNYAFM